MTPLKLQTKYFTLEIFRRGIIFTVASLLLASGVNLVNGNIFLALLSIVNKQVFNEESQEYGFFVGIFLILISLFLFYLIIINWRVEVYSKTFIQVRKSLNKYVTMLNYRTQSFDAIKLRELHNEAYNEYLKTVYFLNDNQTNLDLYTYNAANALNNEVGSRFLESDVYIKELNKIENNIKTDYSPSLANKEIKQDLKFLSQQLDKFVELIKEKEKFKIVTQN